MRHRSHLHRIRPRQPLTLGTLVNAVEASIGASLPVVLPRGERTRCDRTTVVRTLQRLVPNATGLPLPASPEPDDVADSICAFARGLAHPATDEASLLLAVSYVLLRIAAATRHECFPMTFPAFRLRVLAGQLELEARALIAETANPRVWHTLARRAIRLHEEYRAITGKPLFILFPSTRVQALLLLCGRFSDGSTPVDRASMRTLRRLFRQLRDRDGVIVRSDDAMSRAIETRHDATRTYLRRRGLLRYAVGPYTLTVSMN